MFQDQRDFRAIALRSPKVQCLEDLHALLPAASVLPIEFRSSVGNINVGHVVYLSPKRFVERDEQEWEMIAVRRGRKVLYKYSIYLLGMRLPQGFIGAIAVPFQQIALDVFESFRTTKHGRAIRYQRIELARLVEAVRNNRHLGGHIKLTRLEMQVYGESDTKSVMLGGPDVPHSRTYQSVLKALGDCDLAQRRCRVLYDDREGARFALDADRFGNFWFHVAKGARNLSTCAHIFAYFYTEGLATDTLTYPVLRDSTELG